MQTTRTPYSISFMRQCYFYCSLLAIAPLPTQLSTGCDAGNLSGKPETGFIACPNNDPASVYLIQSWIENAGDKKTPSLSLRHRFFPCKVKKRYAADNQRH